MSIDRAQPVLRLATLLRLSWGDPAWPAYEQGDEPEGGVARYTDAGAPLEIAMSTYRPLDPMLITMGEERGGVDDVGMTLLADASVEPFATVMRGAHPPITALVEEIDLATAARQVVTRRRIATSRLTSDGAIECVCAGPRETLANRLGLLIDPNCDHRLGDRGCGVELADYTFEATITAIDGRIVTAALFDTVPTVDSRSLGAGWMRFGSLTRGGLSLGVADHDGETVTLWTEPPQSWVGQTISATAGCPKHVDICRDRFDNEARFRGAGIAIPPYHPVLNDRS